MDAETFRDEQRAAWDSVASAWSRWMPLFEQGTVALNEWLVAKAGVGPGSRVLDVAFGMGEPSLTSARAAAPGGRVHGVDLSPEMARLAGRRAAAQGIDNVEFTAADAQELSFDSEFDAATCRWGIMLMREPLAGLRSIHRALKPGARFATAVWAAPEKAPLLSLPRRAMGEVLGIPAPDPDEPGPFRLHRPGQLAALVSEVGFEDVEEEELTVAPTYDSFEDFRAQTSEMSSSLRKKLEEVAPADVERFWQAVEQASETHREPDGRLRLESACLCVAARKPT